MGSNPVGGSYENGLWDYPPTEGGPLIQTGRKWKTSKMIAELRLYKKKKLKKKKNHGFSPQSLWFIQQNDEVNVPCWVSSYTYLHL